MSPCNSCQVCSTHIHTRGGRLPATSGTASKHLHCRLIVQQLNHTTGLPTHMHQQKRIRPHLRAPRRGAASESPAPEPAVAAGTEKASASSVARATAALLPLLPRTSAATSALWDDASGARSSEVDAWAKNNQKEGNERNTVFVWMFLCAGMGAG